MIDETPDYITVSCPECGTRKTVEWERSAEVVRTHNENRHDSQLIAGIRVQTNEGVKTLPHPDDVEEITG